MPVLSLLLFAFVAVIVSGCGSADVVVERTRIPHIDGDAEHRYPDRGPAQLYHDPVEKLWAQMDHDLGLTLGSGRQVGCLPFVSYDSEHPQGWVSQLGVKVVDELAARLAHRQVQTRNSSQMKVHLASSGVELFYDGQTVGNGAALGLDVLVFGSVRMRDLAAQDGPGAPRLLEIHGRALDVASGRFLAEMVVEVSNDTPQNHEYWVWSRQPSSWNLEGDGGGAPPAHTGD